MTHSQQIASGKAVKGGNGAVRVVPRGFSTGIQKTGVVINRNVRVSGGASSSANSHGTRKGGSQQGRPVQHVQNSARRPPRNNGTGNVQNATPAADGNNNGMREVMEQFSQRLIQGIVPAITGLQAANTRNQDALRKELKEENGGISTEKKREIEEVKRVLDSLAEYVKYSTCVHFLDHSIGHDIYIPMSASTHMLRDAAALVLEDGADLDSFLSKQYEYVLTNRRGEKKTITKQAMYFGMRGQQRAHENIRKSALQAFFASLPIDNPLNPASGSSADERKEAAKHWLNNPEFMFDARFRCCWLNAFKAAIREAHSTAQTSSDYLNDRYGSEGEVTSVSPSLPQPYASLTTEVTLSLSTFSCAMISMKLKKQLKHISGDKNSFRISHGPAWADEVLELDNLLRKQDQNSCESDEEFDGDSSVTRPIFFDCTTGMCALNEEEREAMRKLRRM